jgi:hypothetical protein
MRREVSGVDLTGLRAALGRDLGVGLEGRVWVVVCDVSRGQGGDSAGVDMMLARSTVWKRSCGAERRAMGAKV